MTLSTLLSAPATIGYILAGMAILGLLETAIPLHRRGRWNRAHVGPNFALMFITFATNALYGAGVVLALNALEDKGFGLLHLWPLPPLIGVLVVVAGLDLAFYLAHVSMHHAAPLWRFHKVHHSDPAVDVTTTIRQHPVEGVVRYAFMATGAAILGASPAAFAIYRVWAALNGLLEHANIRMPRRLDTLLSLVVSTPNMHKVHHSRSATETDSNYGNIFSLFDRLFSTFTPSERGQTISYGLDGTDDPATQTTVGLLALPFRETRGLGPVAATSDASFVRR